MFRCFLIAVIKVFSVFCSQIFKIILTYRTRYIII
nr:MAG TPA: hypothetical protein [Caudoviricetes sp.]DAX60975.1 MAG TPA: hypothetical protein [Caudoviricetes sp.]